jgi:imidazolonepropionase-like amidohydrolase
MIIINARIYTMSSKGGTEIIENGYVKISGGLIDEVGDMKNYKKNKDEIIEAGGKWLLPGFIDAHTHLGMYEDGIKDEGNDLNEGTDPCSPQLRAVDAINPMDRTFDEALAAGVTCVATGPGSANPISGQFAVIKTYGKRIDDMIIKAPVGMKFALGENPKIFYGEKNQAPETRMATAAIIRENLRKAKKYGDKKAEAENSDKDEKIDEPDFDIKLEALLPVVDGKLDAHIHAHRADDIFTAIRICKEFDLKYIVVHCTEGHLIAKELAKDNVRAIVGPIICDRSKPELKNLELSNAKVLNDAGILFSLTTDHPVAPVQYLPYCAALAVKGGLDIYDALKAITINPAMILGIDNIVGSIEKGKHADLVLCDGNPLEILSSVEMIIVNGEVVSRK